MEVVQVRGDLALWRERCRELLDRGVPPAHVLWRSPDDPEQGSLLGLLSDSEPVRLEPVSSPRVSPAFVSACRLAIHHTDPARWGLLYRLLWRLTHGEPGLMEVRVDPDVSRLCQLEAEVRRESHKAKAFVRFRRVCEPDGEEHFIAWHRLEHPVVPLIAPFFADRFAAMRWSLLTPRGSVSWVEQELRYGPPCAREQAPQHDELEALWKTYYRAIFNPARIKISAMMSEMPQKHWPTLPETEIITELLRQSPERVRQMIALAPSQDASSYLPEARDLSALHRALPQCHACDLCARVNGPVLGEGQEQAEILIVGEQPGVEEDRLGRPFVGPAGAMLDALLIEAGIERSRCYLTNSVKAYQFEERHGVRRNKNPSHAQVNVCKSWLMAEIQAVSPRVIVALGGFAAFALMGRRVNLERERGLHASALAPNLVVTYHPAAVLRSPEGPVRDRRRADCLADLRLAATRLL